MEDYDEQDNSEQPRQSKKGNILPLWGNERSMNLNPLILTNIQSSHYFKVNLYELKTYHEVIDEIYYKVSHLEPWEKGSRKTAGQTGMCGGVRGVGAGGIVSTAYCLLYKLFTLRLTRKQLNGLINHADSPFIRSLGFMYIRYTQPPGDLFDWYDEYLEDPEELDVKAGGGQIMTIGEMLRAFLTKLEWFSTLFPRIPVPIQQQIERQLNQKFPVQPVNRQPMQQQQQQRLPREFKEDNHSYSGHDDRWNSRGRSERDRSPVRNKNSRDRTVRDAPRDRRDDRDRRDRNKTSGDRNRHSDRSRDRERDRDYRHKEDRHRDRHRHR